MHRRTYLALAGSVLAGCTTVGDPSDPTEPASTPTDTTREPAPTTRRPETTTARESSIVWNGEGGQGLDHFRGDREMFSIETEDPIGGTRSVVGEGSPHGGYATIVSHDGLPQYPEPGDTIEVKIRVDDVRAYGGVLWGVPDVDPTSEAYRETDTGMFAPPGYQLYVDLGDHHNVILCRLDGGGDRPSSGEKRLLNWDFGVGGLGWGGELYRIRIDWGTDGVHHVRAFESDGSLLREGDAEADIAFAQRGGVGFMNNSSRADDGPAGKATIDDFRIT